MPTDESKVIAHFVQQFTALRAEAAGAVAEHGKPGTDDETAAVMGQVVAQLDSILADLEKISDRSANR